jgi:hypothetical protein
LHQDVVRVCTGISYVCCRMGCWTRPVEFSGVFLALVLPGPVSACLAPYPRGSVNRFPLFEQEFEAIAKSGVKPFHLKLLRAAILKPAAEKAAAEKLAAEKAASEKAAAELAAVKKAAAEKLSAEKAAEKLAAADKVAAEQAAAERAAAETPVVTQSGCCTLS